MVEVARNGPPVILDHMVLYTLLCEDDFYDRVPVFHFLKQMGQDSVRSVVAAAVDSNNAIPGQLNVRGMLQPVLAAFVKEAFSLAAGNRSALEPLLDFMAEKRGVRPSSIVIYRKGRNGAPEALRVGGGVE